MKLHHVQVSMPRGEEAEARRFYRDAVGLHEIQKPPSLQGRGGCWFRAYEDNVVAAEIHLGAEEPFAPAQKAHPALVCADLTELEAAARRIEQGGYELSWTERDSFEGYIRFHADDGSGNRLEMMTPR